MKKAESAGGERARVSASFAQDPRAALPQQTQLQQRILKIRQLQQPQQQLQHSMPQLWPFQQQQQQ
jgi:hypothetical protein